MLKLKRDDDNLPERPTSSEEKAPAAPTPPPAVIPEEEPPAPKPTPPPAKIPEPPTEPESSFSLREEWGIFWKGLIVLALLVTGIALFFIPMIEALILGPAVSLLILSNYPFFLLSRWLWRKNILFCILGIIITGGSLLSATAISYLFLLISRYVLWVKKMFIVWLIIGILLVASAFFLNKKATEPEPTPTEQSTGKNTKRKNEFGSFSESDGRSYNRSSAGSGGMKQKPLEKQGFKKTRSYRPPNNNGFGTIDIHTYTDPFGYYSVDVPTIFNYKERSKGEISSQEFYYPGYKLSVSIEAQPAITGWHINNTMQEQIRKEHKSDLKVNFSNPMQLGGGNGYELNESGIGNKYAQRQVYEIQNNHVHALVKITNLKKKDAQKFEELKGIVRKSFILLEPDTTFTSEDSETAPTKEPTKEKTSLLELWNNLKHSMAKENSETNIPTDNEPKITATGWEGARQSIKIGGIMKQGDRHMVMIDGKIYRKDDIIEIRFRGKTYPFRIEAVGSMKEDVVFVPKK